MMAHILEIPIRLQFLKIPCRWALYSDDVLYGQAGPIKLTSTRISELDGWRCRDEFFDLPKGDNAALREYLDKVGLFAFVDVPLHRLLPPNGPEKIPIRADEIWAFRESLRNGLLPGNRKDFRANHAPRQPVPKSLYEAIVRPHDQDTATPDSDFRMHFELSGVASGVVTTANAHRMLLATAFVDHVKGLRFKVCDRKDCNGGGGQRRIFALENEHERKYCSQYCGHIESVRRNRRIAKGKRG